MGTSVGGLSDERRLKIVYQVNGEDSIFQEKKHMILYNSSFYTPDNTKEINVTFLPPSNHYIFSGETSHTWMQSLKEFKGSTRLISSLNLET